MYLSIPFLRLALSSNLHLGHSIRYKFNGIACCTWEKMKQKKSKTTNELKQKRTLIRAALEMPPKIRLIDNIASAGVGTLNVSR